MGRVIGLSDVSRAEYVLYLLVLYYYSSIIFIKRRQTIFLTFFSRSVICLSKQVDNTRAVI